MGESGIVMEGSTGTILYEKNMHDTHYLASITKIMTVLLAIENSEMDEIVTVPPEAVYMEEKGSHIALDAGEQLTVEQCLYAIMLASANDAAYDMVIICVVMQDQREFIYSDTLGLLNYGLDYFTKNKIREDKAFFEEMLKKENPTYENCFISKIDIDNSYIIIPKGLTISDLEIKLDYGGTETSEETVTARYFYKNHLVGQIGFLVESTQQESDDAKNTVQVSISEEKESEEPLFNWKSFIFVMIAVFL